MIGDRAGKKSVRDRIVHHESVSPGVVNIGRGFDGKLWVRLHGEAEDLNQGWGASAATETLSDVLAARIECVEVFGLGLLADLGIAS